MPVAVFDVTTGVAGLIVIVSICVPVPPAFVAFRVSTNIPDPVGIPLITPVEVLIVIPAGNVPPTV